MAASTTTSARAPEVEQSHTGLNEPSMEDILASIRRIIAEDQSNSLGRSGLGGLTRRTPPAAPAPSVEEAAPPAMFEEASAPQVCAEPESHAGPQADMLQHSYETAAEPSHAPASEPVADYRIEVPHAEAFEAEPVFETHDPEQHFTQAEPTLAFPVGVDEPEPLMSPVAGASITSSFQTLAESVVLQDPDLIERVMRESMRPLLKAWLDDHLPSIVERLVRTEIERVARGGRARNA